MDTDMIVAILGKYKVLLNEFEPYYPFEKYYVIISIYIHLCDIPTLPDIYIDSQTVCSNSEGTNVRRLFTEGRPLWEVETSPNAQVGLI